MVHFFKPSKPYRLLVCCTLVAFISASLPISLSANIYSNANDVAFAYRIEQLLDRVKKAANKNDGNKLIDLMLDVKLEVETYSGTKIDLERQIDVVEYEVNKNGNKIPKSQVKELKHILKKKEKKRLNKLFSLENYLIDSSFDSNLENYNYIQKHGDSDDSIAAVPVRLTVGVTVALVGLFIMIVPVIPTPIKAWGKDMVIYGVGLAGEACYSSFDEDKKKN